MCEDCDEISKNVVHALENHTLANENVQEQAKKLSDSFAAQSGTEIIGAIHLFVQKRAPGELGICLLNEKWKRPATIHDLVNMKLNFDAWVDIQILSIKAKKELGGD